MVRRARARSVWVSSAVAVLAMVLAGCTGTPEPAAPSPSASHGPVAPSTPPPPAEPALDPEGSAEDNREFFDHVLSRQVAEDASRSALINALIEAGWSADTIEATSATTPLGNAVDSVSVSVRIDDGCLIGQWDGEYTSMVTRVLDSGTCLLGTKVPL